VDRSGFLAGDVFRPLKCLLFDLAQDCRSDFFRFPFDLLRSAPFQTRIVEQTAPFRFAFLSAFSVPHSKHPALRTHAFLPRFRYAPLRGADSIPHSDVWSAARLQARNAMRRIGLRQCIRPVGEALASGHDVLRALFDLTSPSASSALLWARLRVGPV